MREMVFKNITSPDRRKKDLFLSRTIKQNGIICKSEREHHYIIRKESKFNRLNDLKLISKNLPHRQISIIKNHNTKLGKEMFSCNVKGNFYFIKRGYVYLVQFNQSFKVDLIDSKKS